MANKNRLESSAKRLSLSPISSRNKEVILKFRDFCLSNGLHVNTIAKYMCYLPKMAIILGKDFEECTREDIQGLMVEVEQSSDAERTKYDYKKMLKRFYKWLLGEDEIYPPQVRWIKCTLKNHNKMLPEDILTEEEIRRLIVASDHMRDRALISMLYEGGLRIGETMPLRIKHIEFNSKYVRVTVPQEGKTGVRGVILVNSTPYIANWIAHHPDRDNPEAYVWVSMGKKARRLSYNSIRSMLIDMARKAEIRKRVNPHSFRHARATHLAKILTESQMKQYLGWTQGSKMAAVYVHLSGRDVDNKILEMHGIQNPEEQENSNQMKTKVCPVCDKTNEFEARICCRCGRTLDLKLAMDEEATRERMLSGYLSQRPDILEDLKAYLKAEFMKELKQELNLKTIKTEILQEFRKDIENNNSEMVIDRLKIEQSG